MAGQVGLTRDRVLAEALDLVDEAGFEALTLARLAERVGVRSQSLYAHVDGIEGLRREVGLASLRRLAEDLRTAAIGRAGRDAIHAIADAYRAFESRHPGLYAAALRPAGDDTELWAATYQVAEPLTIVLRSYGLADEDVIHHYRMLWSAIHGFVAFQRTGLFNLPADPDVSFRRMIALHADGLDRARRP